MVMMMVVMDDHLLLGWHRVLLFLAKAGMARPSETKAAKAIANFFMEFLLVVDTLMMMLLRPPAARFSYGHRKHAALKERR
jgi:hypothetical protein